LLALSVFDLCAQQAVKQDSIKEKTHLLRNIRVEVDLVPIVNMLVTNSETYSFETAAQMNINHKYFPIVEIGFAGANKVSDNDINFRTDALFSRIGLDLNLMKPKPDKPISNNFLLAGVRLGFSNFNYDYNNINIENDYWDEYKTYNISNQNTTKAWLEIVAGIRVEIIPKIYMGWSIKYKSIFGVETIGDISPWYIPGYGVNNDSNINVSYSIGYLF
jgi:hypothetical protein